MYPQLMRLRKYEERDNACLSSLRADRQLQELLLASQPVESGSVTATDISKWIERRHQDGYFRVICDNENSAIGFIQVGRIHTRNRHGWMGIALSPNARGRGFGKQALLELHEAAKQELNLEKILLEVRSDNAAAINLYQNLGYRHVGKLQNHYWDSKIFFDVEIYELLLEKL